MKLEGKTVLVTGATGGIGQAIARELSRAGANLILTGRRGAVLDQIAAETGARAIAADLAESEQVDSLIEQVGAVDVLVANAGVQAPGPIDEHSIRDLDRTLAVNLRAPLVLAKQLSVGMVARGGGHIVFVSSLAGKWPLKGLPLYAATKFGLRGAALGMRQDLSAQGVGVSVVLPGFVRDAGMFASTAPSLPWTVRTRSPEDVGRGIRRAILHNRPELTVAPLSLRLVAAAGSLPPDLAPSINKWLMRGDRIATEMAAAPHTIP